MSPARRSGIFSLVVAALLVGASMWLSLACTAGSGPKLNRFGAAVLVPAGVSLSAPPRVLVALTGSQRAASMAILKSAGYDARYPLVSVQVDLPTSMKFDIALAGVVEQTCKVDDEYTSIVSMEPIDSTSLISYDREINSNVMSAAKNPRTGVLVHLFARSKPSETVSLTCQARENPEQPTAVSRSFSIDSAFMPGGFGAQSRPRSTSGETIVFPERVTLQAPPEAMHITFDGASPAGEYIPEEDDATAPSDFFALSMDAPVLSAQWDDKHAYTVDNFGLFVAGGLFGLGIGALIDSVKSLIARQPKPTA